MILGREKCKRSIAINDRAIGPGSPVYIVAEMSANHNQDFDKAVQIIRAAKDAGADAIKLQTYTPDAITIDCDNNFFKLGKGSIWEGYTLFNLYEEACTPWEWTPKLKDVADEIGLDLFSTPFDAAAVDFLEKMKMPAYKIASFENIDLQLLSKVARTGKPVIMSTGMASLGEIDEGVRTLRNEGCDQIALLKCTSAYPAPPDVANLRTIPHLAQSFNVVSGLSDHVLDNSVAITSVALGACIIEKHFTLSRGYGGPDAAFSLEPHEFKQLVKSVRMAEKALGDICYELSEIEQASLIFRRSLFATDDIKKGDVLTAENIRSIRPGNGLHPRNWVQVLGKVAVCDIPRGTPLRWNLIG